MESPRPGYKTTLTIHTTDPDDYRIFDLTANWYGRESAEDCLKHNGYATSIIEAVNTAAKGWAIIKAENDGVEPGKVGRILAEK